MTPLVVAALVAVAVVAVVVLGLRLIWTARRLDAVHTRLDLARESLRTQLGARAAVVVEVSGSGVLDPASAVLLADAGRASLSELVAGGGVGAAESDLSRLLREVMDAETVDSLREEVPELVEQLGTLCAKVELGRRILNDQVVRSRDLRDMAHVRLFRLAGHAPPYATVELDADPPPALVPHRI
ncbi:hypothetical protein KLP28_00365 [Nocardioidaceae bacterium]|nr:hypothetical protein KLP28_00365 [Nocardioidaceae bacterium]